MSDMNTICRFRTTRLVVVLLVYGLLCGCGPRETVEIVAFRAEPDVVPLEGGTVVLEWQVKGAQRVAISGVASALPLSGDLAVNVTESRDFVLEAVSRNSTSTARRVVHVVVAEAARVAIRGVLSDIRGERLPGVDMIVGDRSVASDSNGEFTASVAMPYDVRVSDFGTPPRTWLYQGITNIAPRIVLAIEANVPPRAWITSRLEGMQTPSGFVGSNVEFAVSTLDRSAGDGAVGEVHDARVEVPLSSSALSPVVGFAYQFAKDASGDVRYLAASGPEYVELGAGEVLDLGTRSLQQVTDRRVTLDIAQASADYVLLSSGIRFDGFKPIALLDVVRWPKLPYVPSVTAQSAEAWVEVIASFSPGGECQCPGFFDGWVREDQGTGSPLQLMSPPRLSPSAGDTIAIGSPLAWTFPTPAVCKVTIDTPTKLLSVFTSQRALNPGDLPLDFEAGTTVAWSVRCFASVPSMDEAVSTDGLVDGLTRRGLFQAAESPAAVEFHLQ